jgi:hypothetical protein
MQKIALHPKEMNIGLMQTGKTNWMPFVIFAVIIIGIMWLTHKAKKSVQYEAVK